MQVRQLDFDLDGDPVLQFGRWFDQALEAQLAEPTACALATADAAGRPSVRMVLLKSFDERGFVFSTNYESRKAAEIEANPQAALCFYWQALNRQVRVEGAVARVETSESDAIYRARPRGARVAAWASAQSRPIPDRALLEARVREIERLYPGEVPRPAFWGGYRVEPRRFEYWLAREHRLHDRFVYTRGPAGRWVVERLAP